MEKFPRLPLILFIIALVTLAGSSARAKAVQSGPPSGAAAAPVQFRIPNAPIPMRVLVQGPTDTDTELQVICLFKSDPAIPLRGALSEMNEKLKGLLDRVRKPGLFRGDLGETLLITPAAGTIPAKKLLIVGVGELETFSPERMEVAGSIVFREANRLGVAHPFFSPTLVDGGMTKYTTGQVSEEVVLGFLRAATTEKIIQDANGSSGIIVQDLTYLAGAKFASSSEEGIEKAIAANAGK